MGKYYWTGENEFMDLKKIAGETATQYIESGMVVGLGTGSTACFAIKKLGERILNEGLMIQAIPTSKSSETLAVELGIPLLSPGDIDQVDITIDGDLTGVAEEILKTADVVLHQRIVAFLALGQHHQRSSTHTAMQVRVISCKRP